jgi:predicted SPOUT superfamily RNA methylase MTH1
MDATDLTLAVPSSLVREATDKREATRKLGYAARAAAVFRAGRLAVFPDREGEGRWGGEFVRAVLGYAATPPSLREGLWGRRDELEYAGVLPPLRVPARTGSGPSGPESTTRTQGLVTEVGPDGRVRVNCAFAQHPISLLLPDDVRVRAGERVAIRVSSREPVRARIVGKPEVGFQVVGADLAELPGLRIATSRHGDPLAASRLPTILARVREADATTVAFGAPERGLPAITGASPPGLDPARAGTEPAAGGMDPDPDSDPDPDPTPAFDLWVNAIPNQGSEVVRTEEAMFAALAPLTLTE